MLKNSSGNIISVKYNGNGNIQCEMFKDATTKQDWETNHTPDNEPERFNIYVGQEIDNQLANTTPDPDKYPTLADAVTAITEQIALDKIKGNPRLLPRAKWDKITYKIS